MTGASSAAWCLDFWAEAGHTIVTGTNMITAERAAYFFIFAPNPRSNNKCDNLRVPRPHHLHRRARHRNVGTENATIASLWFKVFSPNFSDIKKIANVRSHLLKLLAPAFMTGNHGRFDHE